MTIVLVQRLSATGSACTIAHNAAACALSRVAAVLMILLTAYELVVVIVAAYKRKRAL
jgi:hypothetical protein